MNLMHKLNISMNKNINSSKKDLLNNNINKFVNLILTNKPISFFQKNKVNNNNSLVHKIHISGKGYSLKNLCLQNSKISLINNIKNIKKLQLQESIKSKNSMIRNKINHDANLSSHNSKRIIKNKKLYLANKKQNEIPNDNSHYFKRDKYDIKYQKSASLKKSKIKTTKSISICRNLNISGCSLDRKKIFNKSISPDDNDSKSLNKFNKISSSINGNIKAKNKYLIKEPKKINKVLKIKDNSYIKNHQKLLYSDYFFKDKTHYSSVIITDKKKMSDKNMNYLKTSEKNNTNGNITTNISDKENTNFSTKKNNLTTHSNNILYFTTNFNNSTNITETNNDMTSENKISKQKRTVKKRLGLPFHPNSKKEEFYNHIESKKLHKRNYKSEIYIPYNKNNINNKSCRLIRDNSSLDNLGIHKNIRNIKDKNDSFFDLFSSKSNKNFPKKENNNSTFFVETFQNNSIASLCLKKDENEDIGVEMAHFRIIAIIQENKRLLNKEDN